MSKKKYINKKIYIRISFVSVLLSASVKRIRVLCMSDFSPVIWHIKGLSISIAINLKKPSTPQPLAPHPSSPSLILNCLFSLPFIHHPLLTGPAGRRKKGRGGGPG